MKMKNYKNLKEVLETLPLGKKIMSDKVFRTLIFTAGSMSWNLIYGILNGVLGIVYSSLWFAVMGLYYLILGYMRFSIVALQTKTHSEKKLRKTMYKNGILLIILAFVLSGTVALCFILSVRKGYNKIIMITIATYTFYNVVSSIRNIVIAHKEKSSILIALRNISLAGATASILSLQRSMTATFGSGETDFANIMEGATGLAAFVIVFSLGILMIIRQIKSSKNNHNNF